MSLLHGGLVEHMSVSGCHDCQAAMSCCLPRILAKAVGMWHRHAGG
jgi:hypothetical protein